MRERIEKLFRETISGMDAVYCQDGEWCHQCLARITRLEAFACEIRNEAKLELLAELQEDIRVKAQVIDASSAKESE